MFERFTDGARRVVVGAQEEARLLRHDSIGTEHLLLGLFREDDGVAARALSSFGISPEDARAQVEEIVGPVNSPPSGHVPFTPRAKKVLELSLREALWLGHNYIGTEHLLLGLVREGEGVAAQVLRALVGDLERVREAVVQLVRGEPPPEAPPPVQSSEVRLQTVPGGPMPFGSQFCSLCGRDLWEVDRYVQGESAVVCDVCVTAAHAALDGAAEDARVVTLPPRVFGADLAAPDAAAAIVDAFETVCAAGSAIADHAHLIEGGDELRPFMEEVGVRARGFLVSAVHVGRIRFAGRDRADVRFSIELNHGHRMPRDGVAVRRGDRWVVSRATIAAMIAPLGVHLPPA